MFVCFPLPFFVGSGGSGRSRAGEEQGSVGVERPPRQAGTQTGPGGVDQSAGPDGSCGYQSSHPGACELQDMSPAILDTRACGCEMSLVKLNCMTVKKRLNLGGRPPLFRKPAAMNIKLESEDYQALKDLAERRETTPSALVRRWIVQGIARSRRKQGK